MTPESPSPTTKKTTKKTTDTDTAKDFIAMPDDRPLVVALAGPGSNSGKTTFVCEAIRRATSDNRVVAALKISVATPDHRCGRTGLQCSCLRFDGAMRILRDDCIVDRPGKDTFAMKAAGAAPVWWLQTTSEHAVAAITETLRDMTHSLTSVDVIVVEGAAPIRAGLADVAVVVARANGQEPKAGWWSLIPRADVLLLSTREGDTAKDDVVRECRERGLRADATIAAYGATEQPIPDDVFWRDWDRRLCLRPS